jgi:hypothetical protein
MTSKRGPGGEKISKWRLRTGSYADIMICRLESEVLGISVRYDRAEYWLLRDRNPATEKIMGALVRPDGSVGGSALGCS